MKTILYFQSSLNASNNSELDGVYRYAKTAGWRIHVMPYADAAYGRNDGIENGTAPSVGGLLKFTNSGSGPSGMMRRPIAHGFGRGFGTRRNRWAYSPRMTTWLHWSFLVLNERR